MTEDKRDDIGVRYGHILQVMTDWIDTTVFVAVCGRGTAKSTVIQARRMYRCVYDMPGAPIAVVGNTYSNLENNIMPAVENGWKLMGWIEGVHYVKDERPPETWRRRCSVIVNDYKHVYTFFNGTTLFLGSLDNPSLLAGKSVVHLFFDEVKYAREKKANRALPILRGDAISYGHSHLFLGLTITTDMPDISDGEDDWYFRYAKEMEPLRIEYIVAAASERNRLLKMLIREEHKDKPSPKTLRKLERQIDYFNRGLLKMRKGATFFINTSSLINIDILTGEYIERLYNGTLELHEFLKSVIGMKPGLRRDLRFYVKFSEEHKYIGTKSGEAAYDCSELVYLNPEEPLDGGMDFGNMLSLVIAQRDGNRYRIHKSLYEIPPGWFRELADQFIAFFASHRRKELNLYYDRAGNNFQSQKEDYASKIKDAIEKDSDGRRTGWTVRLMSRKQAVIRQEAEYDFMQEFMALPTNQPANQPTTQQDNQTTNQPADQPTTHQDNQPGDQPASYHSSRTTSASLTIDNSHIMSASQTMAGRNKALPRLLIDAANCRELVASIEKARAEVKYIGKVKVVHKVKKSEKLAPKKLPMNSTNFSDAFKYLLMRTEWTKLIRACTPSAIANADGAVDAWFSAKKGQET